MQVYDEVPGERQFDPGNGLVISTNDTWRFREPFSRLLLLGAGSIVGYAYRDTP